MVILIFKSYSKTPSPVFCFLLHKQLRPLINICHIDIYHSEIDGHVCLNILKGQAIGPLPAQPSVFMGYWWATASRRWWLIWEGVNLNLILIARHFHAWPLTKRSCVHVEMMNYSVFRVILCIFTSTACPVVMLLVDNNSEYKHHLFPSGLHQMKIPFEWHHQAFHSHVFDS